jgi:chromosome segregation ATPase
MSLPEELRTLLDRLESRLGDIDAKLATVTTHRNKSMEWIAQLSEHVRSLDEFREEVRASFEPVMHKLSDIDDVMRIMRHATSDVARRVEDLEGKPTLGPRKSAIGHR